MYNYRQESQVVAYAQGDVTGDGIMDQVFLMGMNTPDSPFVQDITLIVQDGLSGRLTITQLDENAGYDPTLFLGDFTGDGVSDVLVRITTGGSGGTIYAYLYSFLNNEEELLFDGNAYNNDYQYQVNYLDDYKVRVVSEQNQMQYIIDISKSRDKEYLNEIYDSNGNLKNPIEGWVNPLSGLYPVDYDSNGVYELLSYQRIAGRYNADSLGDVLNILAWDQGQMDLERQSVAIFGSSI